MLDMTVAYRSCKDLGVRKAAEMTSKKYNPIPMRNFRDISEPKRRNRNTVSRRQAIESGTMISISLTNQINPADTCAIAWSLVSSEKDTNRSSLSPIFS